MSKTRRIAVLALAAVMVCAASVAGTLAYLTNTSGTVKNTFTAMGGGRLLDTFSLLEAAVWQNPDGTYSYVPNSDPVTSNEYSVVPGMTLPKDPYVKITGKTEVPSYLYLEVADGVTGSADVSWDMDTDWAALMNGTVQVTGSHGGKMYYYNGSRAVGGMITNSGGANMTVNIIRDKTVTIADDADMADFTGLELQFYSYICQSTAGDGTPAGAFAAAF